jgi:hypothetical protein
LPQKYRALEKNSLRRRLLLAGGLPESRGSAFKEPKYALITSVGSDRRMGCRKELAEGVSAKLIDF